MKKELTIEELEGLRIENDRVKGSSEYNKYYMYCTAKTNNKWHYCGWSIPHSGGATVKKISATYYIMQGEYRYEVTDSVNNILNIY